MKQEKRKRPPTGGGAIYPQTGPSHACVESKEEVDGVLGALGGARDPRFLRSRKAPCQGKTARSPLRQPQATNTSREALIERVGICMTKQCRRAPRQTKEEVSNTTTLIAAAAAPAARLLLKRAGAGAPGILSRAGGLTFITSKEVQKWSVWRTAAFMPPPPATCQRPEIHATCQRPEIHATCQRPEIYPTCQRPKIHATCQRPETRASSQLRTNECSRRFKGHLRAPSYPPTGPYTMGAGGETKQLRKTPHDGGVIYPKTGPTMPMWRLTT